jgi:hypothetical protein
MLRAEAAVFTPKDGYAMPESETLCYNSAECMEQCSTAAPSPALGAADLSVSPMLSPYWGFEETPGFHATDEAALWDAVAATALYGGYLTDNCGYLPELALPDLEQNFDTNAMGPAYGENADFMLAGLQELQNSLAGYLSKVSSEEEDSTQPPSSDASNSSQGVAPPPGLSAPPGLEDIDDYDDASDLVELPPGLEVTVADLHKTFQDANKEKSSAILPPGTTTAMLRNIPNKYTQKGLVDRLYLAGYRGELDFIYLPIDFKNKCNVGYAFLNFRTAEACARFAFEHHGCNSRDKLPGYNSKKICEVSAARFQGCEENVRRLQASSVMGELMATPEWLPILFDECGEALEFPIPESASPTEATQSSRSSRGRLQRRNRATTQ